jgi:hypothetical protein
MNHCLPMDDNDNFDDPTCACLAFLQASHSISAMDFLLLLAARDYDATPFGPSSRYHSRFLPSINILGP